MGRGLGPTQHAILDTLTAVGGWWMTVGELAEHTGRQPRQIRTAVRALEGRNHVVITREHIGWHGRGEYGLLIHRPTGVYALPGDQELPRAVVKPDDYMLSDWTTSDSDLIRQGVPSHGLAVWLTESWEEHEAQLARVRRMFA